MTQPTTAGASGGESPYVTFNPSSLLRGEPEVLLSWIDVSTFRRTGQQIALVFLGSGLFGASLGIWRDPLQAIYTGFKLPLILLLTVLGNALVNGMLAPLLGIGITIKTSLSSVLLSFALASTILGAFSPIVLFVVWNLPSASAHTSATSAVHGLLVLILTGIIGFAGVVANFRLRQLLRKLGDESASWRLLLSWLSINLLLGSQISWILRPFVGGADIPITFFVSEPLHGSFFGAVWDAVQSLLH